MKITSFLLIILFISLAVLGFKVFYQNVEYVNVEVIGSGGEWWYPDKPPPSWLADSIYVGDTEYSPGDKKLAEVLSIMRYEEGPNKIFIAKIRLMVSRNIKYNNYRFKQQPLEIGSLISITPGNKKLTGNVISIEGVKDQSEIRYITVRVKVYSQYPWFTEMVKVGDSVVDDKGQELIRILEKKTTLAEVTAYTSAGQPLAKYDPLKRDIEITLKLQVTSRANINYFAYYQPVKIGNSLYLPLQLYNLYDAIVIDTGNVN